MQTKLISCVVAIYNVEEYLENCIQSLISQDYENVEIILVNDGSTDNCLGICKKYERIDKRIKVINQQNAGANVARNTGLKVSTGEWVYFCDGDDCVKKDIFSALLDELDKDYQVILFSNCRLVGTDLIHNRYPLSRIEFRGKEDFSKLKIATMDRLSKCEYNYTMLDSVSIWNKLYSNSFLKRNDICFVPKFPKTQDLSFNLLVYDKADSAVFVNHDGYVYRVNDKSISNKFQSDFPYKMMKLIQWYSDFADKHMTEYGMNVALKGRILTFIRTSMVLYFCNCYNEKSYNIRKKEFEDIVGAIVTDYQLEDFSINYLPLKEKILSFFIKKKSFFLCEILVKSFFFVRKLSTKR